MTTVMPAERRGGGEVVSQALVDALRDGGMRTVVLGYRRPGSRPERHPDDHTVAERPIESATSRLRALGWALAAALRRQPYSGAKYRGRAYRAAARRELAADPELVVVDHAQAGSAAGPLPERIPLVHVAHNAEHALYGALAERASGVRAAVLRREARQLRGLEAGLVRRAAEVWTLSDDDAETFRALGATRTRTFETPGMAVADAGAEDPNVDVALLGNWTWQANAAGLDWFCEEVLPALPDGLTVAVGGMGSDGYAGRAPRARLLGPVDDAAAFLRSARVVAVPSVAGGGVQVKTLDAIAAGRPVVATPVATRGLGELPATVTVAGDGPAFASALAAAVVSPAAGDSRRAAAEWSRARERRFREQAVAAAREAAGGAAG